MPKTISGRADARPPVASRSLCRTLLYTVVDRNAASFPLPGPVRVTGHLLVFALLTALTQIGGLAWLLVVAARRRWLWFPPAYAALWLCHAFGSRRSPGACPCPATATAR